MHVTSAANVPIISSNMAAKSSAMNLPTRSSAITASSEITTASAHDEIGNKPAKEDGIVAGLHVMESWWVVIPIRHDGKVEGFKSHLTIFCHQQSFRTNLSILSHIQLISAEREFTLINICPNLIARDRRHIIKHVS